MFCLSAMGTRRLQPRSWMNTMWEVTASSLWTIPGAGLHTAKPHSQTTQQQLITEFWANQKQSAYKPTAASVTPGVWQMLHHKEPCKHFYPHLHSDSSHTETLIFSPSCCSFSRGPETRLPAAWHGLSSSRQQVSQATSPCSKVQGALG